MDSPQPDIARATPTGRQIPWSTEPYRPKVERRGSSGELDPEYEWKMPDQLRWSSSRLKPSPRDKRESLITFGRDLSQLAVRSADDN